ncbi:MAG: Prokaryotic ubiquitin-like protein Pup, partial [uncultured Nocardioidaceae bacterium]
GPRRRTAAQAAEEVIGDRGSAGERAGRGGHWPQGAARRGHRRDPRRDRRRAGVQRRGLREVLHPEGWRV